MTYVYGECKTATCSGHYCFVSLLRYAVVHLPTCPQFTKFYTACKYQAPSVEAHACLDARELSVCVCVCATVGVCSGSHCTHCDVCAGSGRCHLQAIRPGHGCQGSSAPADPPAGSTCPVWTPVLSGHGVRLQPHSLCILQRSNDDHLATSTGLPACVYLLCTVVYHTVHTDMSRQFPATTLHGCTLPWFDRKSVVFDLMPIKLQCLLKTK